MSGFDLPVPCIHGAPDYRKCDQCQARLRAEAAEAARTSPRKRGARTRTRTPQARRPVDYQPEPVAPEVITAAREAAAAAARRSVEAKARARAAATDAHLAAQRATTREALAYLKEHR